MKKIFLLSFFFLSSLLFFLSSCQKPSTENLNNLSCNNNNNIMQTNCPKSGDLIAIMNTNYGEIRLKLFPQLAPSAVKNFKYHADKGNYNNNIFHRVIKNFMIQGGDFEFKDGRGGYSYKGPGTSFNDEIDENLKHIKGALSMANRGPNTNGSQFFIVQAPEVSYLDGKYTIFGQLYEGTAVLD